MSSTTTLRFARGIGRASVRQASCLLACLLTLAGCQHALPFYLAEQGFKQGALHLRARSIDDVLADPMTEARVRSHLETVREARGYAREQLGMDTKGAYERYVALDRDWVVQAVTAAHRDRLEPSLFKYPFFGALPYRGYFDENDAREYAARLESQGLDVSVRPVQAYSTTGWLADPVYSSMFGSSSAPPSDGEARLAELIFHELTHTQFYFSGQADFNEAFASWFGYQGALSSWRRAALCASGASSLAPSSRPATSGSCAWRKSWARFSPKAKPSTRSPARPRGATSSSPRSPPASRGRRASKSWPPSPGTTPSSWASPPTTASSPASTPTRASASSRPARSSPS